MSELIKILLELLLILAVIIFLFIYSIISTDLITTLISFSIFLIILIPFYFILEKFKILIFVNNLEKYFFFKYVLFVSLIINIFIGFYLFIQLLYLMLSS